MAAAVWHRLDISWRWLSDTLNAPGAGYSRPWDYLRYCGVLSLVLLLSAALLYVLVGQLVGALVPAYALFSAAYWLTLWLRARHPGADTGLQNLAALALVVDGLVVTLRFVADAQTIQLLSGAFALPACLLCGSVLLFDPGVPLPVRGAVCVALFIARLLAVQTCDLFPVLIRPFLGYAWVLLGFLATRCAPDRRVVIVTADSTSGGNESAPESDDERSNRVPPLARRKPRNSEPGPLFLRTSSTPLEAAAKGSRRRSLPVTTQRNNVITMQMNLQEAQGLIGDLLYTHQEGLSPHVVTCLRMVHSLLAPSMINFDHCLLQRVAEDPITGEKIPIMQRTNSMMSGGWHSVHTTWSTVTSATGLPTLEPEPSRSRSSSFWKKVNSASPPLSKKELEATRETRVRMVDGTTFDMDELQVNVEELMSWSFPVFDLAARSPRSVLSETAFRVFSATGLFRIFKISHRKFFHFFHALEQGYWDIPSAMHDYDHPGRTNAFLVATKDPRALLYNDRSVLENHHVAAGWRLLTQSSENFFVEALDAAEFKRFRFFVVEVVLATDLKFHFDLLEQFSAKAAVGLEWNDESDRLLTCKMLLKLADINSPTRPKALHHRWTQLIVEEFFLQGDEERAWRLPVSAFMDRANPQIPKLQDSFIAHLVSPLVDALFDAGLLPVANGATESVLRDHLRSNHDSWLAELQAQDKTGDRPSFDLGGKSEDDDVAGLPVIREHDSNGNDVTL